MKHTFEMTMEELENESQLNIHIEGPQISARYFKSKPNTQERITAIEDEKNRVRRYKALQREMDDRYDKAHNRG